MRILVCDVSDGCECGWWCVARGVWVVMGGMGAPVDTAAYPHLQADGGSIESSGAFFLGPRGLEPNN